ncbi:MAG: phospholipase [Actinomycetota bacterium]|nr:phospholipase [Actinomycetota bacterium]
MRVRIRGGLVAAVGASVLLGVGAPPALAWKARTTEGTSAERRNTTTPLPPGGDQCSLGAPDRVPSLYDFSWACYAHDVCYQNHQLNGRRRSRLDCDNIFAAKMAAECNARHGRWNPKRYTCHHAASKYWAAVRATGRPAWNSWNGPPG